MDIKIVTPKKATLPIEYKSLSAKDFEPDYIIKNGRKTVIEPDNGRISGKLAEEIDLFEKNTVAVNAGVGQGKSTACIGFAKDYYGILNSKGEHEYLIIFATPFKSILAQYDKLLTASEDSDNNLPTPDVFNYESLTGTSDLSSIIKIPIHLITINSLLGNYGDEGFMQAKLKINYLHALIKHCHKENKKVIIFFDEIHDGIESFQQKYIFNLWKWHGLIAKIFVLSATFSESAKVILKYLADLTDDKLHLIESRRVRVSNRLAPLNICLTNNPTYTGNDEFIAELLKTEIQKNKRIHILSFSEKLADEMVLGMKKRRGYEPTLISKLLSNNPRNERVVLCTGGSKKSFNEEYWNVGTNFKTGINIKESNTSFFIILPPLSSYYDAFEKYLGIFTNGSNTVVQSIARLRKPDNNELFIIMPKPSRLIDNSPANTGTNNYLLKASKIKSLYELKYYGKIAPYKNINDQFNPLKDFHDKGRFTLKRGFDNFNNLHIHIKSRSSTKPRLEYPDLQEFIMEDGDRYLASTYEIFGSDLSSFVIWAAFNNQFENVTLKDVYYEDSIPLTEGEIVKGILDIYDKYLYDSLDLDYISEKKLFDIVYDYITNRILVTVNKKPISKYKDFKKALITVVKLIKRPSTEFESLVYPNGRENNPIDYYIDKHEYLRAALNTVQSDLIEVDHHLPDDEKTFLVQYRRFYLLTELYKKRAVFSTAEGSKYVLKKDDILDRALFTEEEQLKAISIVKYMRDNDSFFKDETYSFFQWAKGLDLTTLRNDSNEIKECFGSIIDYLRLLFFGKSNPVSLSRSTILRNENGLEITRITKKPYPIEREYDIKNIHGINLIYNSSVPFMESTVSEHFHTYQPPAEGEVISTL